MTVSNNPLLPGIALHGYRSLYGSQLQVLAPLAKVNLLAGQNNAGKSNILQFVKRFLNAGAHQPEPLDLPIGVSQGTDFTMAIARRVTDVELRQLVSNGTRLHPDPAFHVLSRVFQHDAMRLTNDDLAWFQYRLTNPGDGKSSWGMWRIDEEQARRIAQGFGSRDHELTDLTLALRSRAGSAPENVQSLLELLSPITSLPKVEVVEAFRQIRPSASDSDRISPNGEGLVRGLQRLERPSIDRQEDKRRFDAINRFVQTARPRRCSGVSGLIMVC